MKPIAPLMIEHRLIERMINLIHKELELNQQDSDHILNLPLLKHAVYFIRYYADKTHHGKEEDILFRELKIKEISAEHKRIMNELIQEHIHGRKITGSLHHALELYEQGNVSQIDIILSQLNELVNFYPKHIDKEDNHFFKAIMSYFSEVEQQSMLEEGRRFDRKMIHRYFLDTVKKYESEYELKLNQNENWLEYL